MTKFSYVDFFDGLNTRSHRVPLIDFFWQSFHILPASSFLLTPRKEVDLTCNQGHTFFTVKPRAKWVIFFPPGCGVFTIRMANVLWEMPGASKRGNLLHESEGKMLQPKKSTDVFTFLMECLKLGPR